MPSRHSPENYWERVARLWHNRRLIAVEDAEQIQEHIDEVQVKGEAAKEGELHTHLVVLCSAAFNHHRANLLRVVGCEAAEDKYACIGDNPVKRIVGPEYIDNSSNNQTYQCHETEATYGRKVLLDKRANQRHGSKCACRGNECLCDNIHIEDQEDAR